VLLLLGFYIWVRGTLPRLRVDQLMSFAWKFMLPMTLFNLVVAALWHFTARAGWPMPVRWVLCGALLLWVYWLLGRSFSSRAGTRVYRYAG
jgi:NADH-quinone oxidoreductase subunit H